MVRWAKVAARFCALVLALAGGGSFTTTEPSLHTTTNLQVIEKFLPVKSSVSQINEKLWKIEIMSL